MNKLLSAVTLSTLIVLTGCSDADDSQDNNADDQATQQEQTQQNGNDASAQQQDDFESDQARLAYAVGVTLARNLHEDMEDLDVDNFTSGIKDVYDGDDIRLSDQQIGDALQQYQQQMIAEQQQQMQQQAEENAQAGQQFLEENAGKDGVETTDSGLQYRVMESGDDSGAQPGDEDQVRVNYEGRTIDGEVFDSSYERGEPVTFQTNQVIPGWQEALKMMHPGDQWEIYVPSDLAYGEAGTGPIEPNQTLIFKVELLDVGDDATSAAGDDAGTAQPGAAETQSAN
ncbi:FKBP-type peptidyl-prolyl cis-trans isomerase [Kushneria indalinina]|uniref:Peptidyl-prolyl cis-trans isomerase n=1 Tax=Kushneria indalinina DSM 14324 TaxID=1122140 RepID=A0A3D9DTC6_9GAMM|nr:FKBP-type peptidyl-prolyl cis-trans isomerase [Kushneria indalinina]REC93674.1 FKBP-type peptidyl-prolyl cis-trans isomerase FklB [Kushneria indalinina DSM 14324]